MKIRQMKITVLSLLLGATCVILVSCGGEKAQPAQDSAATTTTEPEVKPEETDPMKNKGIGPVKSLTLGAIDDAKAKAGEELFTSKCSACHKLEEKYVGPALGGITERRTPEWIMNMILNPQEMVEKDPIAKQLLAEFLSPMANQSLTEDEAGKILEYFRSADAK